MSFLSNIISGDSYDEATAGRRKTIIAVVAVVIILGSITFLIQWMRNEPKVPLEPYIGVGQAMAEQTAKALNSRGRIVVLQAEKQLVTGNITLKTQWDAFQKGLKGIEIQATEGIVRDPQNPDVGISREQWEAMLAKYAAVDAVVSFVGLPPVDPSRPLKPGTPAPKVVVFMENAFPVKQHFVDGAVTVLIRSRLVAEGNSESTPNTPREWFDRYFQVFDESNYQSIPD